MVSLLCLHRSCCLSLVLSNVHSDSVNRTLSLSFVLPQSCAINLSLSLKFGSISPFLSPCSLPVWLSHCFAVNVPLCLTHFCSVNHFSHPFSVTLAASTHAVTFFHSLWFLSVFLFSFSLFASILCCPSSSLTLVLAILFLTCPQRIVLSPHCQSFSLTHSLTHSCSVDFFSRLVFVNGAVTILCCQCFSLTFVLSFFLSFIFDHCCCLVLVL